MALIVGLGAVGAYLYMQAGAKTPVLVVVRDVPAGHTIERADVSTVEVSGAVTAIAASHLDSVIGQTAAVPMQRNMLLQRSMVSAPGSLSRDQAEVGVAVKGGQIPADGLTPGDRVSVLQLPSLSTTGSIGTAPVLVESATVYASRPDPSQAGGDLLTLIVPTSSAAAVAAASGAGRGALVKVAAR